MNCKYSMWNILMWSYDDNRPQTIMEDHGIHNRSSIPFKIWTVWFSRYHFEYQPIDNRNAGHSIFINYLNNFNLILDRIDRETTTHDSWLQSSLDIINWQSPTNIDLHASFQIRLSSDRSNNNELYLIYVLRNITISFIIIRSNESYKYRRYHSPDDIRYWMRRKDVDYIRIINTN